MTADEFALLAAVRADPADDTVRLAYADFLDETGRHAHAAFVRHGVRLNRSRREANKWSPLTTASCDTVWESPRWRATGRKTTMLGSADVIRSIIPSPDEPRDYQIDFRRGFVVDVFAPARWIMKHAAYLFARHPIKYANPSDLDPFEVADHLGPRWRWTDGARLSPSLFPPNTAAAERENRSLVPGAVFAHIPNGGGLPFLYYDSKLEARAAVMKAFLAYGRAAALAAPAPPAYTGGG